MPLSSRLLLGCTFLLAATAAAQPTQPTADPLPAASLHADQQSASTQASAEAAPEATAPVAVLVVADENGFRFSSVDDDFVMRLRGDVQADGRFFVGDEVAAGAESFYLRRVRLALQGTVFGRFDFTVMPNFGMGRTELQDAFLDARLAPALGVRVGKFKTPVGLEFQQSPTTAMFIEWGYPTGLVPNRDVGVELHGDLLQRRLSYSLALFKGGLDGGNLDGDLDDGKDVMARLFATPFRTSTSPLKGLGLGIAATTGRREGTRTEANLPVFRTSGRQTIFRYRTGDAAALADGPNVRLVPQGSYYHGPVGLLAEYVFSRQDVTTVETEATLTHRAWQVAAGYVLTGEDATPGRLRPARAYDWDESRWGAVELVGRLHGFAFDEAAFPVHAEASASARSAFAWGVGLNWYLNASVRFMLNYEQTRFGAAGGAPELDAEHLLLTRFQLAF